MAGKTWPDAYRTTVVCIDTWNSGVPTGRFYNHKNPQGRAFHSLMHFLQEMEQTLDALDYAASPSAVRRFAPPLPQEPPDEECRTGVIATFALRILFRQNVSWQGCVTWLEGKREQTFRSALELLLLVNNAMELQEMGG